MDLIEQDTNTPVDKTSNWYVIFRTKRGKLLPFLIMIYKLQLLIRSSKVSSLCTQCSDRTHSFSSSATSWFRTPNFQRSKATDEDAGEAAYRRSNGFQCFDRTNLEYRRPATGDRRPASRRIRFQRSTQQIGTLPKRCTGDRRPATGESPYQIPTFNTTDWCTGDRRPASRRIRFQRSTQQIGTPTNWRTDVSTPNVTTQQISAPANWHTGDRRLLN